MCASNSDESQLALVNGQDVGSVAGGKGDTSLFINDGRCRGWGAIGC